MMPSGFPHLSAIISGVAYGLRLATRTVHPQDLAAHPQDAQAIWQALWFRLVITTLNGMLIFGFDKASVLIVFFLICAIDCFSYPVISHRVLAWANLTHRYQSFIIGFTWVSNLRILIMMTITLLVGLADQAAFHLVAFPFALWMLWAAWSVSTQALGRGGWAGAGMLMLAMVVEMLLGVLLVAFVMPAVPLTE